MGNHSGPSIKDPEGNEALYPPSASGPGFRVQAGPSELASRASEGSGLLGPYTVLGLQ